MKTACCVTQESSENPNSKAAGHKTKTTLKDAKTLLGGEESCRVGKKFYKHSKNCF